MTVENGTHNHTATLPASHPAHRKADLSKEVIDYIRNQSRTQITPVKIVSHLRLNTDEELPLLLRQDIYNARAHIRREALGPLEPTQALMKYLNGDDWFMKYKIDDDGLLTHLFFCRASSKNILKHKSEVLLINATYKTNRYKLFLVIVTGCTALNSTYNVAFAFVSGELIDDYT